MAKIFEFSKYKNDHHVNGEAFCLQCDHEWQAVSNIGATQLECPECHTMKGLFRFPFIPNENQSVWECNCGNNLFLITPDGNMCANCGVIAIQ